MAVARETLTRGREAKADEFLEKIDCGDRIAMNVREKRDFGAVSFTGDIPFWRLDLNGVATPDQHDAAAEPLLLAELGPMRFKLSKRAKPMSYTWRSTTRDELHFIHRGTAWFLTELGQIEAVPGRFIYIARGVRYRVVPTDAALFDFILESETALRPTDHWKTVDLAVTRPRFPLAAEARQDGAVWEERILGLDWSANVKRAYDPLRAKEVVGAHELAFAVDMGDIPNDVPGTHRPLRLFSNNVLDLDISKQGEGEGPPFHHRNNVRNEIHFVHSGNADQATELGYIEASAGVLYCMPYGIEHTFGRRAVAPNTLLFETMGTIRLKEGIAR
jgi:mannose-6-phosphate isomerase-like protein (cupin superfamily)